MTVNGSLACDSRMPARIPDSPQPTTTTGEAASPACGFRATVDRISAGEVGDHSAADVPARLEVVEDGRELRQLAPTGHVAPHPTGRGEGDELPHVLHGADRRIHERGVLHEELEG